MEQVRLSEINMESFSKYDTWKVVEETIEEEDLLLIPAFKNNKGMVSKENVEVWCLSEARFLDGTIYPACSMSRGDSDEDPLLWSVWNGSKYVTLIVPPAPDYVLENEGPESFSKEFNKKPWDIFPLSLEIMSLFEVEPHKRSVLIGIQGIISK